MTIELNGDASPEEVTSPEDAFWEKFHAAWVEEDRPTAEEICRLAREDHNFDLAPKTVRGWLDKKHIPRLSDTAAAQPFGIVLKVLRVEGKLRDWERLARVSTPAQP